MDCRFNVVYYSFWNYYNYYFEIKMNKVTYKTLRIGDIVQTVSFTHKFNKDKLIAINTSDVYNGTMGAGTLTPINKLKGQFKKTIQKGDILFSEIRPANRRFAKVSISDCQDFVVSTKLMVLRKFNDKVDANYFFYCLTNQPFLDTLQRRAENRIGSFPQITFDILAGYTFPIPPLDEQKRIAKVIFNIDRKIELNKAINDNLEAMAKQLYDYWFVQFDFPNEEGKPYKSSGGVMVWNEKLKREIPQGWDFCFLENLLTIKNGRDHKHLADGIYPVYGSGGEMRKASEYLYDGESVLMPRKGSLNNILYVNEAFWTVDTMFYSEMKQSNCAKYIYYTIKDIDFTRWDSGTGVPSMTSSTLYSIKLVKPQSEILKKFDEVISPLFEHMKQISEQNSVLTKQRDELLPLLMNGQATVNYHLSSTPTTAFGMINKASTGIIGTAKFDMD